MTAEGAERFDHLMERALYGPEGFYERGGRAGPDGDFLTAVEVGPLFGEVTALALDSWWTGLGGPDPFVVVEGGAGRGQWCRMVRAAQPACAAAMRWVAVERSRRLRAEAAQSADATAAELPGRPSEVLPGVAGHTPAHVVLANELLDNLPVRLMTRTAQGWSELFVQGERPSWQPATDSPPFDVAEGSTVPWQVAARDWVDRALDLLAPGGRLVCLDYCSTTAELARRPWTEWLRTYARNGRGTDPWKRSGEQDITCEVCHDQLGEPLVTSQAAWLAGHGLEELVAQGRRLWRERAHQPDLAAVKARSRVSEAAALTDPTGMGSFSVLEWLA